MTSSVRSPQLGEVINRAVQLALANLFVMRTGRIEKFDASTGLADVKPLQKEVVEVDGGTEVVSLAVVPNVPVMCLGGGDFADTFPVAKGDECLLIFADRSLDLWFELGGEQDPLDLRRHNLTDGIALVGLRAKPKKLSEWDTARRVIGKQGGPRIAVSADTVHLGVDHNQDATEKVVLGSTYRQKEDTWFQDLSTQLTQAGTALQLASTSMTTAASANAPPYTGGASAVAPFTAAAQALGQAASALSQIASKLASFSSGGPYLSEKVKAK